MRKRLKAISILALLMCFTGSSARAQSDTPDLQEPGATAEPSEAATDPQTVDDVFSGIAVHGLLQGWFRGENASSSSAFSVRRAELGFAGIVAPRGTTLPPSHREFPRGLGRALSIP